MSNPVVHFEMPYEELERVTAFYRDAFGWGMEETGEEMGNYVLAQTTETGEDGRPSTAGAINGGFFPRQSDRPALHPSVVIAVDHIRAAMQAVTDAGRGGSHGRADADSRRGRLRLLRRQRREPGQPPATRWLPDPLSSRRRPSTAATAPPLAGSSSCLT